MRICLRYIFNEDFLIKFPGKIDIIFIGLFLHLFTCNQQNVIVAQLVRFLRSRKNLLVFGRHLAATREGGILAANSCGSSLYHHSTDTIRQLWDIVLDGEWKFSSELVRHAHMLVRWR